MNIVDVVNFNGDASCLYSSKWLKCLEGGEHSLFVQWLKYFVQYDRKVNLGLLGTTVKDMAFFNPESIDFINSHPNHFELLVRPFSHDSPLLRLPSGFKYNLEMGRKCIEEKFDNINNFYLAPEIMVTSEQIAILQAEGVDGIFIHKSRYDEGTSGRIPDKPYIVNGTVNSSLLCIPFVHSDVEEKRLKVLHDVINEEDWIHALPQDDQPAFLWRDGESCFLMPFSIEKEAALLKAEQDAGLVRSMMSEVAPSLNDNITDKVTSTHLNYYPLHPMSPWLDEMKMYWFTARVRDVEKTLSSISQEEKMMWLLTLNSDILSSVEKAAPVIDVSSRVMECEADNFLWEGVIPVPEKNQVLLTRSERASEGEDYLAYLDLLMSGKNTFAEIVSEQWKESSKPHLLKGYARLRDWC